MDCYPLPRRSKRHIACSDFLCFARKVRARSFCCSSFPPATRFAGLAGGGRPCGRLFFVSGRNIGFNRSLQKKMRLVLTSRIFFWVSLPLVAPPFVTSMPGGGKAAPGNSPLCTEFMRRPVGQSSCRRFGMPDYRFYPFSIQLAGLLWGLCRPPASRHWSCGPRPVGLALRSCAVFQADIRPRSPSLS